MLTFLLTLAVLTVILILAGIEGFDLSFFVISVVFFIVLTLFFGG